MSKPRDQKVNGLKSLIEGRGAPDHGPRPVLAFPSTDQKKGREKNEGKGERGSKIAVEEEVRSLGCRGKTGH